MLWIWVMAFNTINILVVYNRVLIFSLAAGDAANLTALADKRVAAGFISIDCGMTKDSRYDTSGLYFVSDAGFINTGRNMKAEVDYELYKLRPSYNTLRSFPDGDRNCYSLKPLQGKNKKYLIRASFHYGNYDGLNIIPQFDVYIGVYFWVTINSESTLFELIYTPPEDLIYVCLVKTGSTTPFISTLELRPLNNSMYNLDAGSLVMLERATASLEGDRSLYKRKEDDPYDRLWAAVPGELQWGSVKTDIYMKSTYADAYELPSSVLNIASTPVSNTSLLSYSWKIAEQSYNKFYCLYWHFAEIDENLEIDDYLREFTISIPERYHSGVISLRNLQPLTVVSPVIKLITGSTIEFFIEKTNTSKLPPILNAFEIYEVRNFSALLVYVTDQNDVNAIMNVKTSYYTVPTSWQGDPCLPNPWHGFQCSINDQYYRITSLNLTSSGLAGDIPSSLFALTALTNLDLSYNYLKGVIPDFLAKMPSLHIIDLRGNMLNGQVPVALNKKVEDGSIILRLEDNPNLCISYSCKEKNSKKMVITLAAITPIIFIFIVITILICILKRKKAARYIKNASLKLESRNFTYTEVMNMTNNFQTIIGKGGSGAVYHGSLQDGTPVAVKMLNESSTLSLKLFRTEAELLTRVHHRSLVSLIGYCEEGKTMALIYEHVINGSLQQHISDKNIKVLCWKERLQIAIDVAQGLEYMHSGCKPPIVHRDMKSSNILLDENMHAKISDFGISKTFSDESSESGLSTKVMGTHGYVDPEYYSTRRLNKKSDVFSFGVVLLELITGKSSIVISKGEAIHIIAWTTPKLESGDIENIVDKRLEGQFSTNSAWKALEIAMMCVSSTAIQRPNMNQVLSDLNECFAIEMPQGRKTDLDNHGYGYPTTDIAIADSSIEIGPTAR